MGSGIIITELFARKVLPEFDSQLTGYRTEEHNGITTGLRNSTQDHFNKAGEFRYKINFNAAGFRDKRLPEQADKDSILVIGDSFAFGFGVNRDARFSDLLESKLNIKVVNIAFPSHFKEYKLYLDYARKRGSLAKKIIIAVCMENDIKLYSESGDSMKKVVEDTYIKLGSNNINNKQVLKQLKKGRAMYEKPPKGLFLFNVKSWLKDNSTLYRYSIYLAYQSPKLIEYLDKVGLIINQNKGVNIDGAFFYSEEVVKSSVDYLLKISSNNESTILIIPSRSLWVGSPIRKKNALMIHNQFVKMLKDKGLQVVDMKAKMEEGLDPLSYHFKTDGHWNESGHELAAEELKKALK